jgi:hypothetical protein
MTAATWPQASGYDDVVDLSRYPINDPEGPAYRALVRAGRDQLRDQGVAQLTGSSPRRPSGRCSPWPAR